MRRNCFAMTLSFLNTLTRSNLHTWLGKKSFSLIVKSSKQLLDGYKYHRTIKSDEIYKLPFLRMNGFRLVFLAYVFRVPRLFAYRTKFHKANLAFHRHRHIRIASFDLANCLAICCWAPCSAGVKMNFWKSIRNKDILMYITFFLFN